MRLAHKQIEASIAQELLDRIRVAPPKFFEDLIVRLLVSMGYGGSAPDAARALGRSGDDGVDGVIDQDALGLDRVYVQAKRYKIGNNVGSAAIRDFFGSLDRHKAAKGLFVTTSTFTPSARKTAEMRSKRIVLIDVDQLSTLMIRYNVGCRVEETVFRQSDRPNSFRAKYNPKMIFLQGVLLMAVWFALIWPLTIMYVICGLLAPRVWVALLLALISSGATLYFLFQVRHFEPMSDCAMALSASLFSMLSFGPKWW